MRCHVAAIAEPPTKPRDIVTNTSSSEASNKEASNIKSDLHFISFTLRLATDMGAYTYGVSGATTALTVIGLCRRIMKDLPRD